MPVPMKCWFGYFALCGVLTAADIVVLPGKAHLRSGDAREWNSFPQTPQGKSLTIGFDAPEPNAIEHSLILRQRDVKNRTWQVRVNGTTVGVLLEDERRMVCVLPIAAKLLRSGTNKLEVESVGGAVSDDIEVSDIRVLSKAVTSLMRESTVSVKVAPSMPVRITVVDALGFLVPIIAARSTDVVRTGVVYTPDGNTQLHLAAGQYRVYASRGIEYSAPSAAVSVDRGKSAQLRLAMKREMPVPGYVSVDTHVHTFELSGHGDARIDERVLTAAGEGLDVIVSTEHNRRSDYSDAVRRRGLTPWLTTVAGNEVTAAVGHFNVFPVVATSAPPDSREKQWDALMKSLKYPVVIQNHPRDIHSGYRPFDPQNHISLTGTNLNGRPWKANAMEVVNSGAMSSDPLQLVHDWMGLLTHGLRVAGIGASDTHTVDFVPIGQARTYVRGRDIASGIASGETLVSYGLVAMLRQLGAARADGDRIRVPLEVEVRSPSWSGADTIRIFSNGVPVWSKKFDRTSKFKQRIDVPLHRHDTALVAVATGPGVMEPFWEVRKPYQPTSLDWTPIVLGVSSAIWIDGDKDGKRTSPREYARTANDLTSFDDSVAAHALDLLRERGVDLRSPEVRMRFGQRSVYGAYLDQWEAAQK
jgi:hypothetical protein